LTVVLPLEISLVDAVTKTSTSLHDYTSHYLVTF